MQIKVHQAFGLNHDGSIKIYPTGLHTVSKEVAEHPYTLLNATVVKESKPTPNVKK